MKCASWKYAHDMNADKDDGNKAKSVRLFVCWKMTKHGAWIEGWVPIKNKINIICGEKWPKCVWIIRCISFIVLMKTGCVMEYCHNHSVSPKSLFMKLSMVRCKKMLHTTSQSILLLPLKFILFFYFFYFFRSSALFLSLVLHSGVDIFNEKWTVRHTRKYKYFGGWWLRYFLFLSVGIYFYATCSA